MPFAAVEIAQPEHVHRLVAPEPRGDRISIVQPDDALHAAMVLQAK
jgi:hypothetical protein